MNIKLQKCQDLLVTQNVMFFQLSEHRNGVL